jgi:hypothetical protein
MYRPRSYFRPLHAPGIQTATIPIGGAHLMAETDAVMNAETRRALRRRGRQVGMVVVGAVVAIVLFGVAGLAAILSVPWQLQVGVTVGVTVAVPVGVSYAMLRVLGLAHRDVLYVGKQAYREGVAEAIALSRTRHTADVFGEGTSEIGTGDPAEAAESDESTPADEMDTDESSTESEPTDLQQQAEPQS